MKIGGIEITREKWDEAEAANDDDDGDAPAQLAAPQRPAFHLPDWTRAPLPAGAPPAPRPPRLDAVPPETSVGA